MPHGASAPFQCYKAIKARPRFARDQVVLTDEFESKDTYVYKARTVCIAVDKNGEGMIDPATRLVCYQIKDVPGEPAFARRDVDVSNQFGDSALTLIKSRLLCVPSSLHALP